VAVAAAPLRKEVQRRLGVLRGYRWSSYGAYAGYRKADEWLTTGELLSRMGEPEETARGKYRRYVEEVLRQGVEPGVWTEIRERAVLGTERFRRRMSGWVKPKDARAVPALKEWSRWVSFDRVVQVVEAMKGERWEAFRDRYGDWGRDLVLYVARERSGLSLKALGEAAGGLTVATVSEAVRRLARQKAEDAGMRRRIRDIENDFNRRLIYD